MKPATTPSVARWLVQATDQTKGLLLEKGRLHPSPPTLVPGSCTDIGATEDDFRAKPGNFLGVLHRWPTPIYAEICVGMGLFLTHRARPLAYRRIFSVRGATSCWYRVAGSSTVSRKTWPSRSSRPRSARRSTRSCLLRCSSHEPHETTAPDRLSSDYRDDGTADEAIPIW